jgi:hypothetical protein
LTEESLSQLRALIGKPVELVASASGMDSDDVTWTTVTQASGVLLGAEEDYIFVNVSSGRTIYDGDPNRSHEFKKREIFCFNKNIWPGSSKLDTLTVGGQAFQLRLAKPEAA